MAFGRYKTIARDQHRHGRVACLFDIDTVRRKMHVTLLEARGIDAGFRIAPPDLLINFRILLLPHQNSALVIKVSLRGKLCYFR